MAKLATIKLELYANGIHFICDDTDMDELIPQGDGNKLMELLNKASLRADPDTTYSLTEKGKAFGKYLDENPDMDFDEAMHKFDKIWEENEDNK